MEFTDGRNQESHRGGHSLVPGILGEGGGIGMGMIGKGMKTG
jgi:hypothetical protein